MLVEAALMVALAVAAVACRRAPHEATGGPPDDIAGVAGPTSRPSPSPVETSGARSLEIIRTMVARKEGDDAAGSPPTATAPPDLEVEVREETVAAPTMGLMWLRSADGLFEHGDAVSHCDGLDAAGFTDWRVPEISELDRLVGVERGSPWLGGVQTLWSATPHRFRGVETITFPAGARSHQAVGMAHVVCVRDLER